VLHYIGDGLRYYGRHPIPINQRLAWEFQAVVRGDIGLLQPNGAQQLCRHRLWIFPPNHAHGWHGREDVAAEVVVFHFPHVPEPLRQLFGGRDHVEVPLGAAERARLRLLARQARGYWASPAPGLPLCHELILLELSLIALEFERIPRRSSAKPPSKPVETGLRWFSENIRSDPNLDRVAQAAGVSPAHLRRLFHKTFQTSPKHLFDQLRFQRARQLMADPSIKLEAISEQCGFGSVSAFSRAFRNKFGCSPSSWRVCV
jgi:AraC family transcriptional regulator